MLHWFLLYSKVNQLYVCVSVSPVCIPSLPDFLLIQVTTEQ